MGGPAACAQSEIDRVTLDEEKGKEVVSRGYSDLVRTVT
jgi:hypothetical protein